MPPTNTAKNKAKALLKSLSSTLSCGGCGSRRHRLNLPDVHLPLPKLQPTSPPSLSFRHDPSSTTTTTTTTTSDRENIGRPSPSPDDGGYTSTTFSLDIHNDDNDNDDDDEADPQPSRDPTFARRVSNCSSSRLDETLAVVKDSEDPYLDFKHSMLQVIFEKEIFEKQDLQDLLACFLRLNSPCHHGAIIRAFSEIWRAVMSPAPENEMEVRCSTKCPKEEDCCK